MSAGSSRLSDLQCSRHRLGHRAPVAFGPLRAFCCGASAGAAWHSDLQRGDCSDGALEATVGALGKRTSTKALGFWLGTKCPSFRLAL